MAARARQPGAGGGDQREARDDDVDRLPPEFQERVRQNHPVLAQRPELNTFFEIFEADDAAAFAS